jgi:hypothetical protein
MDLDTTIVYVVRSVVQDVAADGTATMEQVFESIRMDMKSPSFRTTYDSANKDAAAGASPMNMIGAMIGEAFVIVVSPTGVVQRVEGVDRLMEKLFKASSQNPAAAAAMQAMRSGFSDESMKQMLSQGFPRFPDRAVKVGESWSGESTADYPLLGKMTTITTLTLTGVRGQIANIATKLNQKVDPAQPAANPFGMTMKVGQSSGEGELLFDIAKGLQQRSTTRVTMSFSMSVPGAGGAAMNTENVSKSVISVEIVQ